MTHQTVAPRAVPPYSHMSAERTIEEAATEAMRALGSRHAADALTILWQLRRIAAQDGST